jgi:hypothetical protein
MSTWIRVIEHLRDHHGLVDRRDLDRLGVSPSQLRRWRAEHRLEPAGPHVWRLGGMPESWEQRLHAGLRALGPKSWVSHNAAAAVHRFDRTPSGHVEYLVLRSARSRRPEGVVHSTRRWTTSDGVIRDGLRVTSATRTILDLANVRVSPQRLRAAIDSAVRLELSAPEAISRRLTEIRSRGRTGVRLLDDLLIDSGGHTMLEREFLRLMREAGLPRPEPQVVFQSGSRTIARVDFLYREWAIVVEVSGRLGHSTPDERARDAQRRNELQDIGLRVYEFTWEDVTQRPWLVQRDMRIRLRSAGWPG